MALNHVVGDRELEKGSRITERPLHRKLLLTSISHMSRQARFLFAYILFAGGAALFSRAVLLPMALVEKGGVRWCNVEHRREVTVLGIRFYLWLLEFLRLCRVTVTGAPGPGPAVRVFNHPTLFDALIVLREFPTACCVTKAEVYRSFSYGLGARLLGYISAGSALHVLEQGKKEIRRGNSVVIFPSGTRGEEMGKLHRSAARLALETQVPIGMGVITCTPSVLGSGALWYQAPLAVVNITLNHQPFVQVDVDARPLSLQSRELTTVIKTNFEAMLGRLRAPR